MKTYRIACIPGDGIGKEVIPAGQEVLQALAASGAGFNFEFTSFGWGGRAKRSRSSAGIISPSSTKWTRS